MEAALLVVLGWLLGILAGPIGERIRRRYSADDLRKACLTELLELRYTMASCVELFHSRVGTLDHEILGWMEPIEAEYDGPDKDPRALEAVQKLKAMTPPALAAAMAVRKASFSGMSVKQYSMSFLDSQFANLNILPVDLQQRLLQVKDQLAIFNQDVVFLNKQFALTFQSDLGANYAVVMQNLTHGYGKLASRARIIADAITGIRDRYS